MTFLALARALVSLWLAIYGLHAFILLLLYFLHKRKRGPASPPIDRAALPQVTIQVPVYNELHVVERAIDQAAALDYPRDKLHIQVLDDSTDETLRLSHARAAFHHARGVHIEVLRRPDRSGFKAGALNWGLSQTHSEYIAIFDADFCPHPDFLMQTIPHLLVNPRLGLVQTRWSYLNADYSPLTEAQAFVFNGHFVVEQIARSRAGLFMNFNGSGGVWRRRCIEEAGGWQHDTLCEDLDLSYRGQLANWKFLYLPDEDVPAELPPQMMAFKRQQSRWSRGSIQTLRKLGSRILRSREAKWWQKVMGLLHLSNYVVHPLMIIHLLLTLPLLLAPEAIQLPLVDALGLLGLGPSLVFAASQQYLYPDWWRRMRTLPTMLLLVIGIAWCSAQGIWQGLTRWGGTFTRTPKFQLVGKEGQWNTSAYQLQADVNTIGETLLALYALCTAAVALFIGRYETIPFMLLYAASFGMVAGISLAQSRPADRRRSMRLAPAPRPPQHEQPHSDG